MADEPKIGDFRPSEKVDEARSSFVKTGDLAAPMPSAATGGGSFIPSGPPPSAAPAPAAASESKAPALTQGELYKKRLQEANIPEGEAEAIYDAVFSKGFYEETFQLRHLPVVLRTRSYADTTRLNQAIELERPATAAGYDELIGRHNLAGSLYQYGTNIFPHKTAEDYEKILTFLGELPQPAVYLLSNKLTEFDRKTLTVFSAGATAVF